MVLSQSDCKKAEDMSFDVLCLFFWKQIDDSLQRIWIDSSSQCLHTQVHKSHEVENPILDREIQIILDQQVKQPILTLPVTSTVWLQRFESIDVSEHFSEVVYVVLITVIWIGYN